MAYYVVIALYLYGDLAIYAAAVPKSLTQVIWYVNFIAISTVFQNWVILKGFNFKNLIMLNFFSKFFNLNYVIMICSVSFVI